MKLTWRERVLRALGRRAAESNDPVERWKRSALSQLASSPGVPLRPRIELQVSPSFALTGVLAGLPFGPRGPVLVTCGLLTVMLVPELARGLVVRCGGRSLLVHIAPGVARSETLGPKIAGRAAALLAVVGPLANLMAAGVLAAVSLGWVSFGSALRTLAVWHAAWGLAQGLPFAPFALGLALQSRFRPPLVAIHQVVSTKLALLGSVVIVRFFPTLFPVGLLAASGAVRSSIWAYQAARDEKDRITLDIQRAEAFVAAGDPVSALRVARLALARVSGPQLRTRLWKCLAWAAIGTGDAFGAHAALGSLPARERDVHLVASYLAVANRSDEALALLERARAQGFRSRETTKLLLDLLVRVAPMPRARQIAAEDRALLSADENATLDAAFAPHAAD